MQYPIPVVPLVCLIMTLLGCSKPKNTESDRTPSRPTNEQIKERKANIPNLQILKENQKRKLQTIVLPDIKFTELPLTDAIDKLRVIARNSDPESDPQKKGVNVVIKMESVEGYKITLDMKAPALGQVFDEIARQSNLNLSVSPYSINLAPQKTEQDAAANP